jgi:hypothetical protein
MASELVPRDPEHERFDAVALSVVSGTLAVTVAILGAAVLGWIGSAAGWLLLLAAIPVALVPLARWRMRLADEDRLAVGHLDPQWQDLVQRAAHATSRLELAAAQAPPGAVADHLSALTATARHHLRSVHDTASTVSDLSPSARHALLSDAALTCRRLGELAEAADRLRETQQRQLGADPLAELVEATDHLTATLGSGELPAPTVEDPPPSRGSATDGWG